MKYPYDIVSIVRQKTLSVEAKFTTEKEESPLSVFDKFSRYVLNVIAEKKAATCNIPLVKMEEMRAITNVIANEHYKGSVTEKSENSEELSSAFTKRFQSGTLKGKSPAEVLLENENGKELLNKQYTWLRDNLSKYPKNKELMDAIVEASKLDLSNIKLPTNSSIRNILAIDCRPLVKKKREDGKCFCYECNITYDAEKKYPVSVVVKNYYAPVVKTEKGLLNVILKEKDRASEISNEFNMTLEEWLDTLKKMELARDAYYICNFSSAYKLANEEFQKNRKAATK